MLKCQKLEEHVHAAVYGLPLEVAKVCQAANQFPIMVLNPSSCTCYTYMNYMKTYGARAFAISAPKLWNQLPADIRTCNNLTTFKSKLNTCFLILLLRINLSFHFIFIPCEAHRAAMYTCYTNEYYFLLIKNSTNRTLGRKELTYVSDECQTIL